MGVKTTQTKTTELPRPITGRIRPGRGGKDILEAIARSGYAEGPAGLKKLLVIKR